LAKLEVELKERDKLNKKREKVYAEVREKIKENEGKLKHKRLSVQNQLEQFERRRD